MKDSDVLPLSEIGIIGATSLVGDCLLKQLIQSGIRVAAYSRREKVSSVDGVDWHRLDAAAADDKSIKHWVSLAPITALSGCFSLLEAQGARRVVVLSSTSRFTKVDSSNPEEKAYALRFAEAEAQFQSWAENLGIEWVILRPTLIYGLKRDTNVGEIARFIRRFGFFPILGQAKGLRQPIHAQDVANACLAALQSPLAANRSYNISGGETLTYRAMVSQIFLAIHREPRVFSIPLWLFRVAVAVLRQLPRYRLWTAAMAERMNQDLVFDHSDATRDFGFQPREFKLSSDDI
ncbi:NAD(P)-dependent oxidoreductase [Methylicorpusculum sp.]|uniref:NAD-dependent epimerase/dehydratase family protein n=1 Tax=Methylicorpusculum sp. TaxID=2713644 RepID=UPI00272334F1|nr:NAD-dependent epimerase/dehydratase family protein [Methylicorpusculum sp.]MDO8843257.1 NAD-dependent epimerase/dehydratase family protein [Methylicorpusculum sp.]